MKKFFILCLMAFVMCVTPACSDIKRQIKTDIGEEIKDLSVKTYDVNDTFYNFLPSYSDLTSNIRNQEYLIETLEDDIEWSKWSLRAELDTNSVRKEIREHEIKIFHLKKRQEDFQQTYKKGKLYVARYREQTSSGLFYTHYTYEVFLYNENKQLVIADCTIDDFVTLVLTTFPKAVKEELEEYL